MGRDSPIPSKRRRVKNSRYKTIKVEQGKRASKRKRGSHARRITPYPRVEQKMTFENISEEKLCEIALEFLCPRKPSAKGRVGLPTETGSSSRGRYHGKKVSSRLGPRGDICTLWKFLNYYVEGEREKDPDNFKVFPPSTKLLHSVAAAPLPGYAMHSLASQSRRKLPVFIISNGEVMDGRNQEILNMTKVTTTIEHSDKKSMAVTKFSSLSPEAIASILQCPRKVTMDPLDMLPISSFPVLLSTLVDRIQNSFGKIKRKLFRGRHATKPNFFCITRLSFISTDAKWYELKPTAPWIVFSTSVECIAIELSLVSKQ